MTDYKILDDGTISWEKGREMPDEKQNELSGEYSRLEYEIFTHPERFSSEELAAKKVRFEYLKRQLEISDENPFDKAREKLKQKSKQDNSALWDRVAQFKKQNG